MLKKNLVVEIVEPLLTLIDKATEPKKMDKADAVEVLELIIDRCRSRLECLREEMADEDNG